MRTMTLIAIFALGLLLCACPPVDETTPDTTDEAVAEGHEGHDHAAHAEDEDADAHPWMALHAEGVTRTAENLDNGVKMVFTSDCPHHQGLIKDGVAAKIEHMATKKEGEEKPCNCAMHAEGVTISSEEVENGTAMIFTTDDAELVPQLQENAQKKLAGEGCGCGGHGKHGAKEGHGEGHGDKPCAGHKEGVEDCAGKEEGEDCGCDGDKEPAAE